MKFPPNNQTTSTKQPLKQGPADMPDRGGRGKPNLQTTSTMVPLSRNENFVAAYGAHPGMGTVQNTSTTAKLSRTASCPYAPLSATTPQNPLKGSKKR